MADPTPAEQALHDQLDAATRETIDRLHQSINPAEGDVEGDDHRDPWVRGLVDRYLDTINAGQALACPHLPGSPQPITAAAWTPRVVLACDLCVILGLFWVDGPEDTTCDRCGNHAHGRMHQGVATAGPITILYGLCHPCFEEVTATLTQERADD